MAHFSASGDSIASLFIVERTGFEPRNNYTLSCTFVLYCMFCILISKVILTSCCLCLATVVLMPFVN